MRKFARLCGACLTWVMTDSVNAATETRVSSLPPKAVPVPARETETEVGLEGRQVFFLFLGSALFACVVFAVGLFVGRRLERNSAARANVQTVSDPLTVLDEIAKSEESLTFHRVLAPANNAASRPNRPANPALSPTPVHP
ncbi:MAG TPA: hypothetical protein PKE31_05150 [Pseudomonadota bacterium]|nr:hypothetical protein [Pseudomonadota bacterium]